MASRIGLGAALALLLALPALAGEGLRVIDGDTFEMGGETIRLLEIDAPESGQACRDAGGRSYGCGARAADRLRALLTAGPVSCEGDERDRYGRRLARCDVKGIDIGGAMVAEGHALAFTRYSDRYLPEQRLAEKAGTGLWSGDFAAPWDFRAEQWTRAAATAAEPGCPIKGNINARGERIYHTPYSRSYAETRINPARGERWFCSEAEAIGAGWRAPVR